MCSQCAGLWLLIVLLCCSTATQAQDNNGYKNFEYTISGVCPENGVREIVKDANGFYWIITASGYMIKWDGRNFKQEKKLTDSSPLPVGLKSLSILYSTIYMTYNHARKFVTINGNSKLEKVDDRKLFDSTADFPNRIPPYTAPLSPQKVMQQNSDKEQKVFKAWYNAVSAYDDLLIMTGDETFYGTFPQLFYYSKGKIALLDTLPEQDHLQFFTIGNRLVRLQKERYTVYENGQQIAEGPTGNQGDKISLNAYWYYVIRFYNDGNKTYLCFADGLYSVMLNNQLQLQYNKLIDLDMGFRTRRFYYDKAADAFLIPNIVGGFAVYKRSLFAVTKGPLVERTNHTYSLNQIDGRVVSNTMVEEKIAEPGSSADYEQIAPVVRLADGRIWYPYHHNQSVLSPELKILRSHMPGLNIPVVAAIQLQQKIYFQYRNSSTIDAIWEFDPVKNSLTPFSFPSSFNCKNFFRLCIKDSTHFFTIYNGVLSEVDIRTAEVKALTAPFEKDPRDINYDPEHQLVFVTDGGGQGFWCIQLPSGKITKMPVDAKEYLLRCHSVVKDSLGYYWMPTNSGVFLMDYHQLSDYLEGRKNYISYQRFGIEYGIENEEFNGGFSSNGLVMGDSVYLASMGGVVSFSSKAMQKMLQNQTGRILLDNIFYNDSISSVEILKHVPPDFQRLSFNFSFPFNKMPALTLEYRLTGGNDSAWLPMPTDGIILLHNMKPGEYTLQVRALNNDLVHPVSYDIRIDKHWYATYWAYLIYALLLLSAIALIFSLRVNVIKNKSLKEINDNRQQLFSIIAHDLRSPVKTYQGLADTISYLIKAGQYNKLEKISAEIDKTGAKLDLFINNLLSWSLLEQQRLNVELEPLQVKVCLDHIWPIYHEMAAYKKINLEKELTPEVTIQANKGMLQLILRNLLDNAIKNTAPGNSIHVVVEEGQENTSIQISNPYTPAAEAKLQNLQAMLQKGIMPEPGNNGMGVGMVTLLQAAKKMNATVQMQLNNQIIQFNLIFKNAKQ